MRALVVIAHYFKSSDEADSYRALGSAQAPLAKIAALNAQIVALHRYFGPRRGSINPQDAQGQAGGSGNVLDIVILTVRGYNLLDSIGIEPSVYTIEYFDGPPLMLPFEAQRVMRERAGNYDVYAYMEDDLIVDDPAFFAKIVWFAGQFGPAAMLMPVRYEMASTGTPAKVSVSLRLSGDTRKAISRPQCAARLSGCWNGRKLQFEQPNNPHAACYVLTDAQLKFWMSQPSFYDRDASWIDPLVSASTYAPAKVFCLYTATEPDPWFLGIEHFGTRIVAANAPPGQVYGEPLLLTLAEAAARSAPDGAASPLAQMVKPGSSYNALAAEAARLRHELDSLKRSRSRLLRALLAAFKSKLLR